MGFWKDLAFLNFLDAKKKDDKLNSLYLYSLEEEKENSELDDDDDDDDFDDDDFEDDDF